MTEVTSFDLHVLSTPPAFVLSQNQTLHNILFRNCWTNESFKIHQYRVTSLRNPTGFHLGAGHGTRHDLFLPSLYPLRCSTRKVVSSGEFFNSASASQKVSKLENCLARLCFALLIRAAQPFELHRVGVPRILPETESNVKPIFLKKLHFFVTFFVNH